MGGYFHHASDTVHTYDNINDTMKMIKVAYTGKHMKYAYIDNNPMSEPSTCHHQAALLPTNSS
jgi:hypothetical protein